MLDNALVEILITVITTGLEAQGFDTIPVLTAYQPTTQGPEDTRTNAVYFFKIADHRYGSADRKDEWDEINNREVHTESQLYETTFQISAYAKQYPGELSYTAADLVNATAQTLNSDITVKTLKDNKVAVLRITDIRNPYFLDDSRQFEASPSFDVTFITEMSTSMATGMVQYFGSNIYRV